MSRFHLFEWGDLPWIPRTVRDFITDHLQQFTAEERLFDVVAPILAQAMRDSGEDRLLDLCSGGGGPFPSLLDALERQQGGPVSATLTDLFPNERARARIKAIARPGLSYRDQPTDAFAVDPELPGMRTMFFALHHFKPHDVRRLLADAVANGRAFAACEITQRDLRTTIGVGLFSLCRGVFATPWVVGMTWARFLLTYVLPVTPLMYAWDGFVSCLRSYTADELRAFGQEFNDGYTWSAGETPGRHRWADYRVTWLIGVPTRERSNDNLATQTLATEAGVAT